MKFLWILVNIALARLNYELCIWLGDLTSCEVLQDESVVDWPLHSPSEWQDYCLGLLNLFTRPLVGVTVAQAQVSLARLIYKSSSTLRVCGKATVSMVNHGGTFLGPDMCKDEKICRSRKATKYTKAQKYRKQVQYVENYYVWCKYTEPGKISCFGAFFSFFQVSLSVSGAEHYPDILL